MVDTPVHFTSTGRTISYCKTSAQPSRFAEQNIQNFLRTRTTLRKGTLPRRTRRSFEISSSEVVDTMKISGRHVSMDAPFVQGEENSLLDVLENEADDKPDSGLVNESLRKEVQRALSTLTQREADVISLYFGLNGEHA